MIASETFYTEANTSTCMLRHNGTLVYIGFYNMILRILLYLFFPGVSGLDELVKLNPRFEEFYRNLFDLSSRSLERSVEDKKANKILNKLIRRFLLLLSPYFLLKASHKALEWLINR
jgi:hypothetical protein